MTPVSPLHALELAFQAESTLPGFPNTPQFSQAAKQFAEPYALRNYFVYPGQPLVIAVQIMEHYKTASAAFAITKYQWPHAVGNSQISGAGDTVRLALDLLAFYRDNRLKSEPEGLHQQLVKATVERAHMLWNSTTGAQTGNHVKANRPGLIAALALEDRFRQLLASWVWDESPAHAQGEQSGQYTAQRATLSPALQVSVEEEARQAFLKGQPLEHNPYPQGSPLFLQWNASYTQAKGNKLLPSNHPTYLRRLVRELNAQGDGFYYRGSRCNRARLSKGDLQIRQLSISSWVSVVLSPEPVFVDAHGRSITASRRK